TAPCQHPLRHSHCLEGSRRRGATCRSSRSMPYGMYISAAAAAAQAQRLEVIANNLANVDPPGFKQDVPTFQARFAEAIQKGYARSGDQSINDIGGGVKVMNVATDYSMGEMKRTGNDL